MTVGTLNSFLLGVDQFRYMNAWTTANIRLADNGDILSGGDPLPMTFAEFLMCNVREVEIEHDDDGELYARVCVEV